MDSSNSPAIGPNSGLRAWIGLAKKDGFETVNLFSRPGFRALPEHSRKFDSVWIAEQPLGIQGWKILIDSCLRMLKPSGNLVVRYLQNEHISLPSLKHFIFRRFNTTAIVEKENASSGFEIITNFKIAQPEVSLSKKWTFGVLTQGQKVDCVVNFLKSVREFGGADHEIIICGPENDLYSKFSPRNLDPTPYDSGARISSKKNAIVNIASHENVCLLHDRYILCSDYFEGFDSFGYDFEFATIRQHHESGKWYPAYCAMQDRGNLIWGQIVNCLSDQESWKAHYLNGGFLVGKRSVFQKIPFNDLLSHNQAEDVELSRSMLEHSIIPRINFHSSTITNVPDHKTDVFKDEPRSDYWPHKEERPIRKTGWTASLRRYAIPNGVNLLLYGNSSGAGVINASMHYARKLIAQGKSISIVDLEDGGPQQSQIPEDLAHLVRSKPKYRENIWCHGFPFIHQLYGDFRGHFDGRKNTILSHWELPFIPDRLAGNFNRMDRILTTTQFVANAMRRATGREVEIDGPGVRFDKNYGASFNRDYFALPKDKFLFLSSWEFTSITKRKNPEAVIEAFKLAFKDNENVALVLHSKLNDFNLEEWEVRYNKFKTSIAHDRIIILQLRDLTYEQTIGLHRSCDCYVSLHRSEGYGMGCAEALAVGKNCIMTNWSGNIDIPTEETRHLAKMVEVERFSPVTPQDYPWVNPGEEMFQYWAEPSITSAVKFMRQAYEERAT